MMSMTGFGRAELAGKQGRLIAEISTLNNRFLELFIRLPRPLSSLEGQVRALLSELVSRGKVSLYLTLEEPSGKTGKYALNLEAAKAYVAQLRKLQKELKLEGAVTVTDLVALPQVAVSDKEEVDLTTLWPEIEKVVRAAADKMTAMRKKEGQAMALDIKKRIALLDKTVGKVEQLSKASVAAYAQKIKDRVNELLNAPLANTVRLEEEIALLADRTDITEECVRFRSHLEQYREAIVSSDAVGRRLNFILQELNREANTMGSKAGDFGVTSQVISIKEELEKIREMVQNVE